MKYADLCLGARDKRAFDAYIAHPSHAFMIVAEKGSGKDTLLRSLADEVTKSMRYNQLHVISETETNSITINQAKQIKSFFRLKSSDIKETRVAVIYDAENMTIEAQNALLKVVEEPPHNCLILQSSSRPTKLLPTIISRVEIHEFSGPKLQDLSDYLMAHGHSSKDVTSALHVTGARPGLAVSMLTGENDHSQGFTSIKELLSLTQLERLKFVDKLSKNKIEAQEKVQFLQIVAQAALFNAISTDKQTDMWAKILKLSTASLKAMEQNASTKLVLTDLFLSI